MLIILAKTLFATCCSWYDVLRHMSSVLIVPVIKDEGCCCNSVDKYGHVKPIENYCFLSSYNEQ